MADQTFDVVVIGAGPGGYVAAIRASQLGLKTAIVEREHMGGICLNWGCIPTKAMLRSSEVFHLMHRAKEFGLKAEGIDYDLDAVVARSRGVAKQLLNGGIGPPVQEKQGDDPHGRGLGSWPRARSRSRPTRAPKTLTAKNIVLATGARARNLPGLEADGERVWSYKARPDSRRICPSKLLVIGSGAIGIEFASFYNTLGAETTVVEVMDRILPVEDAEISGFAKKAVPEAEDDHSGEIGRQISWIAQKDQGHCATIEIGRQGNQTHEFDTVISAPWALSAIPKGLGLEALGGQDRPHPCGRRTNTAAPGSKGSMRLATSRARPGLRIRPRHEGVMVAELIAGKNNVHPVQARKASRAAPIATRRWPASAMTEAQGQGEAGL